MPPTVPNFEASNHSQSTIKIRAKWRSELLKYMFLKRHISFFLLLLISFKTLIVPFVYLDFELRKEYIIQHLCENRFKPQLQCDGKCYLAKTLTKIAEEKAQNTTEKQEQNIRKVLEEIFDEQSFTIPLFTITALKDAAIFGYQPHPLVNFTSPLLRPPAFA